MLTMAQNGIITNTLQNYQVGADGIRLNPGTTVQPESGASILLASPGTAHGYITGVRDSPGTVFSTRIFGSTDVWLGTTNNPERLRVRDDTGGRVQVNALLDVSGNVALEAGLSVEGAVITMDNLPTTAPAQPNRLWRDAQGFLRIS